MAGGLVQASSTAVRPSSAVRTSATQTSEHPFEDVTILVDVVHNQRLHPHAVRQAANPCPGWQGPQSRFPQRRRERDHAAKARAPSRLGLKLDPTPHQLGVTSGNGQTQSGPLRATTVLHLLKRLEEQRLRLDCNPRSRIPHLENKGTALRFAARLPLCLPPPVSSPLLTLYSPLSTLSTTSPVTVNLTALFSRLMRIWRSLPWSPRTHRTFPSSVSTRHASPFC